MNPVSRRCSERKIGTHNGRWNENHLVAWVIPWTHLLHPHVPSPNVRLLKFAFSEWLTILVFIPDKRQRQVDL